MTFNVKNDTLFTNNDNKWQNRKQLVIKTITEFDPDIIALQELTEDMQKSLHVHDYDVYGKARNKKYNFANEKNVILVKRNKYKLISEETFWLSNKPYKEGSRVIGNVYPRICTNVILQDDNGEIYSVFNTHLDHLFGFVRTKQCKIISNYINTSKSDHTIIMGDFNTNEFTKGVSLLKDVLNLQSCYIKCQQTFNTHHGFKHKVNPNKKPIDHIFVSNELDIIQTKIIDISYNGSFPSDHYPVMCEIK